MIPTIGLTGYTIKAVKADIAKGTATITLETNFDQEFLHHRLYLAMLAFDKLPVDVTLKTQQMTLPFKPVSIVDTDTGSHESEPSA